MWYKFAKQLEIPTNTRSREDIEEDQMYDWMDEAGEVAQNALYEFLENPKIPQNWQVVPIARLKKIWNDYATTGIIRDEKGLQEIADLMVKNTLLLHFNTTMSGHTPMRTEEYIEQYAPEGTEWTDELEELHSDHILDEKGQWRLSDYALEPLMNLASQLRFSQKPEEKLYIIDKMLNVVHQRGDIAALFIEGGSGSLNELFELGA